MSRLNASVFAALVLFSAMLPDLAYAEGWTISSYTIVAKKLTPSPSPDPTHVAATCDPSQPSVSAIVTVDGASATADVTYKRTAVYSGVIALGNKYARETGGVSGIATKYANGFPIATSTVTPQSGSALTGLVTCSSNPSSYSDGSVEWAFLVGGDSDQEVSATLELLANGADDEGYATAGGSIGFILPQPNTGNQQPMTP